MRKLVHEETYFLKRLSEGKRVVDIYNYYEKDKHSLMVLELLEGGELFSVVGASNYTLTELKCAHFTLDMLKAVNYIHENQVSSVWLVNVSGSVLTCEILAPFCFVLVLHCSIFFGCRLFPLT